MSGFKSGLDHFGLLAPVYEHFIPPLAPEALAALVDLLPGGALLDAGGGTGRVAQFFNGRAGLTVVADESIKMLLQAQKKPALQPLCTHTEHLPFPSAFFDRIIMVDALHHLTHQAQSAAELWRLLKPGGRLVIEEPDVRRFAVKILALAEKLALMRSHFLVPEQIIRLFPVFEARVEVRNSGLTAWVIVEKADFSPE
ncbi:MAG TPA: class I SAM-dependent methyltransferase [Anaerolineaceae bacterium]|nr:class I SAM-dependent methyltransferase [Anaerolineaceae bacterium]HPN52177.1 class I SAM-dependent methyltransferase [Anaerolineaceae bacterium]